MNSAARAALAIAAALLVAAGQMPEPAVLAQQTPALPVADAPPALASPELAIIDAAIAEGRFDAARDIIARSAPVHDGPALRLRSAELALASGALAEAATGFEELMKPAAASPPAIMALAGQGLGIARLRQNRVSEAAIALDAALMADPGLARAWTARGVIADRARDFAAANAAYAKALSLAPDSAFVLNNHGYSLLLQRRAPEAEGMLARAVLVDPTMAAAQTNLRLARALQGRYKEAFAGATPDRLAADLNTVGFAAMVRGDFATAETYFNRALSQNSRFDAVAWANLRYLKDIQDPLHGPDPDKR